MKLKLDENLPADAAVVCRDAGHDVETVVEESMSGAVDPDVLAAATREGRVLVTLDTDFADVRRFPPGTHNGIVVLRLHDQRWAAIRPNLERVLGTDVFVDLAGGLAIVSENRIRFRRGP